jgi:hypothetical protein
MNNAIKNGKRTGSRNHATILAERDRQFVEDHRGRFDVERTINENIDVEAAMEAAFEHPQYVTLAKKLSGEHQDALRILMQSELEKRVVSKMLITTGECEDAHRAFLTFRELPKDAIEAAVPIVKHVVNRVVQDHIT